MEMKRMDKIYTHPNGYSAKLYGESSISVYFEGKEVLHTGSRGVNTEKEVMELLGEMPSLIEEYENLLEEKQVEVNGTGRLIDADRMIFNLEASKTRFANNSTIREIIDVIINMVNEQETAYDAERVIADLKEFEEEAALRGASGIVADMIDVVERGGVE